MKHTGVGGVGLGPLNRLFYLSFIRLILATAVWDTVRLSNGRPSLLWAVIEKWRFTPCSSWLPCVGQINCSQTAACLFMFCFKSDDFFFCLKIELAQMWCLKSVCLVCVCEVWQKTDKKESRKVKICHSSHFEAFLSLSVTLKHCYYFSFP